MFRWYPRQISKTVVFAPSQVESWKCIRPSLRLGVLSTYLTAVGRTWWQRTKGVYRLFWRAREDSRGGTVARWLQQHGKFQNNWWCNQPCIICRQNAFDPNDLNVMWLLYIKTSFFYRYASSQASVTPKGAGHLPDRALIVCALAPSAQSCTKFPTITLTPMCCLRVAFSSTPIRWTNMLLLLLLLL